MATWTVEILRSAEKEIAAIPKADRTRVRERIDALADDPFPPGHDRVESKPGHFRVRQGDYRIIYTAEASILTVTVVKVGKRGDVYR